MSLPIRNVVKHILNDIIPEIERKLLEDDKPVQHQRVHPEAMVLIYEAYQDMTLTLKEKPHSFETAVMRQAEKLAAAAIKFVADLGDPKVLRHLADPSQLLENNNSADVEENRDDPAEFLILKDMPRLGYLTDEDWARARSVRAARERAVKVREQLAAKAQKMAAVEARRSLKAASRSSKVKTHEPSCPNAPEAVLDALAGIAEPVTVMTTIEVGHSAHSLPLVHNS